MQALVLWCHGRLFVNVAFEMGLLRCMENLFKPKKKKKTFIQNPQSGSSPVH